MNGFLAAALHTLMPAARLPFMRHPKTLRLGAALVITATSASMATSIVPAEDGLDAPIAAGKPKFLGSAYSESQSANFTAYWNKVTPENAGKWGRVEATRDVMNWQPLDAAFELARASGLPFHLHVLIWGNQQPAWIETLPPAEQLEEIEQWFRLLAERYPGMDFVEVVNEPLHDPPDQRGAGGGNYVEALGGRGATGWDWVVNAFRLAREHFPDSQLMINEYSVTNSVERTQQYLKVVRLLQAENLVDIIGVQGHAFSTRPDVPMTTHRRNLDTLATSGLPVHVTEMDVDGPDDSTQLANYRRIFPVFWEHPAVQGITMWGYRPGLWRSDEGAYLMHANGVERPAMVWLKDYVANAPL
jgi:endo-1,4-beta-xylanase